MSGAIVSPNLPRGWCGALSGVALPALIAAACLMTLLFAGRATADIGMSLIALLGLYLCFCHRIRPWQGGADVALALLLAAFVALSGIAQAADMDAFARGMAWARFPLAYAALRLWLRGEHENRVLCYAVAAGVTLMMTDAYWQYLTGVSLSGRGMLQDRLSGPLTHANIGNLLLKLSLPVLPALAGAALAQGRRASACTAGMLALLVMALVPLTGERSITVLMLLGLGVFAGALLVARPHAWKWVALGGICAFTLLMALVLTQEIVRLRGEKLLDDLRIFPDTVYGQLFQGGWLVFAEHPLLGVGVGNYFHACQPFEQSGRLHYCDVHPHNLYLNLLSEIGVIGGALFAVLAIACGRQWWRAREAGTHHALAFAGCGAALLVLFFPVIITQGMFANWAAALFWFSLALTMNAVDRLKEKAP